MIIDTKDFMVSEGVVRKNVFKIAVTHGSGS